MNNRKLAIAVMTTAFSIASVHAQLPNTPLSAQEKKSVSSSSMTRTVIDTNLIKSWPQNPSNSPFNDGLYVSHGKDKNSGKTLYWKATWYPSDRDEPGMMSVDSGYPSSWVLQNSLSFNESRELEWRGWNDDVLKWELTRKDTSPEYEETVIGDWGAQIESAPVGAYIPTWRDGAEGAYTIIHDDFGAFSYDGSVVPALKVAKKYPRIRVGWAVKVDVMDDEEWGHARNMVIDGHEIVNHSWDHSAALEQWSWFNTGDTLSVHNHAIPKQLRGATIGTESDNYPDTVTAITPYVNYVDGDATKPETLYHEVRLPVTSDYSFDSTYIEMQNEGGWTWEEIVYRATGKIEPLHRGWSDEVSNAVPILKILTSPGWFNLESSTKVNITTSKELIDEQLYSQVDSPRFPPGKRTEYYAYPYNSFSATTHNEVLESGHIAARGGSDFGTVTPCDFYEPFRVNFDGFYMMDSQGASVYPYNMYQRHGLQQLVDRLVKTKGYMVRQLHGCEVEDLWNISTGQPKNYQSITNTLYETHFAYIDSLIDEHKLTVYTPSEAIKYRLTANAALSANYSDSTNVLTVETDEVNREYQDEISVIVKFKEAHPTMFATYADGSTPRYAPVKMDSLGHAWSISMNPFTDRDGNRGRVTLSQTSTPVTIGNTNKLHNRAVSLRGISNGKLHLDLPSGELFTATIFSVNGRKISTVTLVGESGVSTSSLSTANLGSGMFILNIEQAGSSILKQKFTVK